MKELQDPRSRCCIECDICGEWAPKSQRSPEQRAIRRLSKLDWICSFCLEGQAEAVAARLRESAEQAKASGSRGRPGGRLEKVRAAAEYILGDRPYPEQPGGAASVAGDTTLEPPVPTPAVASSAALATLDSARLRQEGASRIERLLSAAGMTTTVASSHRWPADAASAAPEQPQATPPGPGTEVAAAWRRRHAGSLRSAKEGSDLALVEQLARSVGREARAAHSCLSVAPEFPVPQRLDTLVGAVEGALSHASAATSACHSLAELLKGRSATSCMATL